MSYIVCKDCTDRVVGCHATCTKYIKEKAENEADKKRIINETLIDRYKYSKRIKLRIKELKKYGKTYL